MLINYNSFCAILGHKTAGSFSYFLQYGFPCEKKRAEISYLTEKSEANVDILQSQFTNTITYAKKNKITKTEDSKEMYKEL